MNLWYVGPWKHEICNLHLGPTYKLNLFADPITRLPSLGCHRQNSPKQRVHLGHYFQTGQIALFCNSLIYDEMSTYNIQLVESDLLVYPRLVLDGEGWGQEGMRMDLSRLVLS